MRASFLARKWHKWLFLIIGLQMCLWAFSGFYMVTLPIDFIHGDHLVKEADKARPDLKSFTYDINRMIVDFPDATRIETGVLQNCPIYRIYRPSGFILVDGQTGTRLAPLPEDIIRNKAETTYAGRGTLSSLTLLTKDLPSEIQGRPVPIWRADFDDLWAPSLYLSPLTGEVITKRHDFWRMFDFLWMLHIMDYENREDVNNWLLRVAAVIVTLSSLTGLWLLFYSFRKGTPKAAIPSSPTNRMHIFRTIHKWLGLIIGLQVTIWALSGLIMALLDHDMVKGRDMARSAPAPLLTMDAKIIPLSELGDISGFEKLSLTRVNGQTLFEITAREGIFLLDAHTGDPFIINEQIGRYMATKDYTGTGEIIMAQRVEMPTSDTPRTKGPAWKITFNDTRHTALFISTDTGKIVAWVNDAQRLFNIALMLHFMDYPGHNHFNSPWIILIAFATLWLALSGIILIFQSFTKTEFKAIWLNILNPKTTRRLTLLDEYGAFNSQLDIPYGLTLYDSLSRAGFDLPSNCGGGGSCGLCRVRLTGKNPPVGQAERRHFTKDELDKGHRLSCQQRLTHDIALELPRDFLHHKKWEAQVIRNQKLTPTIHEIKIKITPEEPFSYRAGSYMMVDIPSPDGQILRRAYSLATPSQECPNELTFLIRKIPAPENQPHLPAGLGSHYMCHLQEGDNVSLSGPFGQFAAKESDNEMVFIGGGAGMAPLRAMVRDQLLQKNSKRKISFWYGVRHKEDIFYQKEFADLMEQYDNFSFHLGLSEPDQEKSWKGPTGFIHQIAMDHYLANHPDLTKVEFYLCGPPALLEATRKMLCDLGIAESKIAFDDFGI